VIHKDLGFIFKASEGSGVDNAVPVSLIDTAILMLLLRVFPPPGILAFHGIRGKLSLFSVFDFFAC
jgi:hypothetical protein